MFPEILNSPWASACLFAVMLLGDYCLQSDWMAQTKTKAGLGGWAATLVHVTIYTSLFTVFTLDWRALLLIGGSHAIIDHYRLARHVGWLKNKLAPRTTLTGPVVAGCDRDISKTYRLVGPVPVERNVADDSDYIRPGIVCEDDAAGEHIVPLDGWQLGEYREVATWHHPWSECSGTGYHEDTPFGLAIWLLIIVDNTMHLCINIAALALFA